MDALRYASWYEKYEETASVHSSSPSKNAAEQFSQAIVRCGFPHAQPSCSCSPPRSPASPKSAQPKLIDVHEHFNGEPGMLDQLLAKLNAADGIGILLVTPKGFPEASKFIHEHPNRFIGFGDIKLDDPDVLNQIDRFHQAGFRGLGEITSALKNYDDQSYWPIYDRAAKYHMILLFHTGIVARPTRPVPADISFDRMRAYASRSDCPPLAEDDHYRRPSRQPRLRRSR